MSERMKGMTRQWQLLRILHGSHYMTIPKLADRLIVATKTIRRDVQCLESAGFPIYFDRSGMDHFVRLEHDWFLQGAPKPGRTIRELETRT